METQVIHSLLTLVGVVFALAAAYFSTKCYRDAESAASTRATLIDVYERAQRLLASIEAIDQRLAMLEKGQDVLTQRHHQQIGRLGALVARVNNLAEVRDSSPESADSDDDEPIDEERREAERERLRAKLAEKFKH